MNQKIKLFILKISGLKYQTQKGQRDKEPCIYV